MLDSRSGLIAGGDSGAAIVPGKPTESLLIEAVKRTGLAMPPEGKGNPLNANEIALLEKWIAEGAEAPEGPAGGEAPGISRRRSGVITEEDRKWWAFQPIVSVTLPEVRETKFRGNEIDRFIQAKLEAANLAPSAEASPAVLIRRVTYDLTGLPPTPQEVTEFVKAFEQFDRAYEALVDELLSRPAYGQRMARHWLDLVRYADGDGYRADDYRPLAWRYRDYVIQSFNDDKPFDRFVQEQLAGDEMFPGNPEATIATGYLRHGIYEWNARDVRGQWDTMLNDITDTTGDVFFGLGIQCARCHDHKFDPISQRDYFRLRAVFAAIQPKDVPAISATEVEAYTENWKVWEEKAAKFNAELATLLKPYLDKAEQEAVARFPEDIQEMIRKPAAEREPLEAQLAALAWRQVIYDWERIDSKFQGADKERILALRRELAALGEKPAPLPLAFAAADVADQAPPTRIPKKASAGEIEPGVLTLLDPAPLQVQPLPNSTGRRTALARWLTAPGNPLTARVIVNRVWQQHFGKGLAANASDFGMLGEKPSHPELLDWLADWFVKEGWSLKELHRLVVTSAAYRRSCEHPSPAAGQLLDPENRLLWRRVPSRLEAEQIRDAMLAISGELQTTSGGPGEMPDAPVRTIYTRFMRNQRDPLADVFDAPLWFTSAASRDTTTTPVQSLLLVNSAALRLRGRFFAARLEAIAPQNLEAQIGAAYELAFGRRPTAEEEQAAREFLVKQASLTDPALLTSGQAAFIPGKVPYRDGQAALLEPASSQNLFRVEQSSDLALDGAFTIEAFVVPRSITDSGALRTIAAKWNGDHAASGWTLGITGQKSRRKPQTVAIQLVGKRRDGTIQEQPVFSDLTVQLHKPYFLAAAVTPATAEAPGQVFFALKDLANDDEPLLTATVSHEVLGGWGNGVPLTIGGRSGSQPQSFDGAIDDVRLSSVALSQGQLLLASDAMSESTLGYWRFEAKPDVFADASPHGRKLSWPERPKKESLPPLTPQQAALADFCQALLNASEFLYVE